MITRDGQRLEARLQAKRRETVTGHEYECRGGEYEVQAANFLAPRFRSGLSFHRL